MCTMHCYGPWGRRLLAFIRHPPPPSRSGPKASGGGGLEGGFREGQYRGGAVGRVGWGGGGVQVGQFGVVRGGGAGGGGKGGHRLPLPCPQSNHTITINLTLTFAASWSGHASHVNWAAQDPPNFVHGCFCHIIALHFGPQHSFYPKPRVRARARGRARVRVRARVTDLVEPVLVL